MDNRNRPSASGSGGSRRRNSSHNNPVRNNNKNDSENNLYRYSDIRNKPEQSSNRGNWRRVNSQSSLTSEDNGPDRNSFNNSKRQKHRDGSTPRSSSQSFQTNNHRKNSSGRRIGFTVIEKLLDEHDTENVILKMQSDTGFSILFNDMALTPDLIVLLLKLLTKICESSFVSTSTAILRTTVSSQFISTLTKFVAIIAYQSPHDKRKSSYFWKDTDQFWYNIITICKKVVELIPTTAAETLTMLLRTINGQFLVIEEQHSIHIADNIKEEIRLLLETVLKLEKEKEIKEKQKKIIQNDEPPPEDFRTISVYPEPREITQNIKPYLRPNVIEGPFRNIEHYLDIQYRLLREDFVAPLRESICDYLSNTKKKFDNVRIYKQIYFLHPEIVNEENCFRIKFETNMKRINFQYENSKRFMYGSLLCFTTDNFNTILFGKVVQRDLETCLKKGELVVGFHDEVPIDYEIPYVMAECKIFFEPYYQVLNCLKIIQEENFPMQRYIIDVETDTLFPDYLPPDAKLLKADMIFCDLNEAQKNAYNAALTQEFAIIQGPPGTGKTYLGLKIVETLLANKHYWYDNTPMLVICYTNHALDQFLEGLIPFTEKLLRIGGQSKNEKLNRFNINKTRRVANPAFFNQKHLISSLLSDIASVDKYISEICSYNSVLDFTSFTSKINFINQSQRIKWLLGDWVNDDVNYVDVKVNVDASNDEEDENDENYVVDEIFENINIHQVPILLKLNYFNTRIMELVRCRDELLQNNEMAELEHMLAMQNVDEELYHITTIKQLLERKLMEQKEGLTPDIDENDVNFRNPFLIPPDDRWCLYFKWVNEFLVKLRKKREDLHKRFKTEIKVYEEIRAINDVQVMKQSLVVGMTTTRAASLFSSLQSLKSPIVVIEEAAEILEAHIIASVTKYCEHLILIGDHQQLKPSTSDFKIQNKYHLGISLFERMILNKVQCYTLNVQHRMRPEISCLITPTIYPVLQNHDSVYSRPMINCVPKPVYFIDHEHAENVCNDTSKKNIHEAKFFVAFARHLILNGYLPEDITILAAYLGQMFEIKREKEKLMGLMKGVRVCCLDNYQGEESNIILLSLVRNNDENNIGFLKIENRICVALSRARNGMYIMGNMKMLCANSKIWEKVNETLQAQEAIGPYLTLQCQIHKTFTSVTNSDDFSNVSEGGCNILCDAKLDCGHKCPKICHIQDKDHLEYRCLKPCLKPLCSQPQHLCKKQCFDECGPCWYPIKCLLRCGHKVEMKCSDNPYEFQCKVRVEAKLICGHTTTKHCFEDVNDVICPFPCEIRVEPCGHACLRNCHVQNDPDHLQYKCKKPCTKYAAGCTVKNEKHLCTKLCYEECEPCKILVKKHRTVCSHVYNVPCKDNVDKMICNKPCTRTLPCGHICKDICSKDCPKCEMTVEKTVPGCNHILKVKCSQEPDRNKCNGICPRKLPCGHVCNKRCNEPCRTKCEEFTDCILQGKCNHIIKSIKCYMQSLPNDEEILQFCNEPCNATLKCGHKCSGTCGKCLQGRIHMRCNEKCSAILICNHECSIPCRETCKPCTKKCEYRCKHSKCGQKCGVPCTPCKEKCQRRCEHQLCTRICYDICNVPPCNEPCPKLLPCRHPCVGFCGEPCPKLCRICNQDELTDVFFGTEGDEESRFVLLVDCGHVIESEGMEGWLNSEKEGVQVKGCPKCKSPITNTYRYSDYIKQSMRDVMTVKRQMIGKMDENTAKKQELQLYINELKLKIVKHKVPIMDVCNTVETILKYQTEQQFLTKSDLQSITSVVQLVDELLNVVVADFELEPQTSSLPFLLLTSLFTKFRTTPRPTTNIENLDKTKKNIEFIATVLNRNILQITNQEIEDLQFEIMRLRRIMQFEQITATADYNIRKKNSGLVRLVTKIEGKLYSLEKFMENKDKELLELLKELGKLCQKNVAVTQAERKEIVKAMGLKLGHWYKCPNGHIYAIGDCGGAMQISRCNECGASIGGQHHALLPGNAVASEMVGARP